MLSWPGIVYDTHPLFEDERCVVCNTNYYDAILYDIACVPKSERPPFNWTSETPNDKTIEKTL